MNNCKKLLNFLHKIFRKDPITKEIIKAIGVQMDNIELDIQDIDNQNFLDTSTWGIDIFENELNLSHITTKPINERKSVIMAKWRGVGILTLELIKNTLSSYDNCDFNIIFTGELRVEIFPSPEHIVNIIDIYKTIDEIKPAHLGVSYKINLRPKLAMIYIGSMTTIATYVDILPFVEKEYHSKGQHLTGAKTYTGTVLEVMERRG